MPPPTTPGRPPTTTRPVSRASSRPASPTKPSSLNDPNPRPTSRASGSLFSSATPRASTTAETGRASPTKRPSSALGAASSSSSSLSTRPPSPTKPRASARPTSSLSSLRSSTAGGATRLSGASSLAPSVSVGDGLAEEDDDRPRRRAGFGPAAVPTTPSRRGLLPRDSVLTEASEADEAGGAAVDGNSRTGSPVEGGAGTSSDGEYDDDGTETETEEEDKDGRAQNVVVCLRVRPPKPGAAESNIYTYDRETAALSLAPSHPTLVKRFGSTSNVPRMLSDDYEFRFDLLHLPPSPTSDLYDGKIRPVVRAALSGFCGTVFAYGATASGKTTTMTGTPSEPGIIPLAIDELFARIHAQHSRRRFALRVSFLEIYNEGLRDLLAGPAAAHGGAPAGAGGRGPEIVENGAVKGLSEREVALPEEVLEVLREGETRRRVGATDWNERSSRSHCVFIVTIESMSKKDGTARTSKLNLIDLAGSESATGQEERRKEGAFINKSLLTLGTVIGKLTDPSASSSHIPYRDSKLTRLLQPALSGNSRVAVVCTISPDAEQAAETLSTLKFAKRAKMVVTKAERGVLVTKDTLLAQYSSQIASLRSQIATLESSSSTSSTIRDRDPAESAALLSRLGLAEERASSAAAAVVEKDAELARLRALLDKTRSLVLTGPGLERSARRVSGAGVASGASPGASAWDEVLSPSRSRSLRLTPGRGAAEGKRCASEMSGLGLGRPGTVGLEGRFRASVGGRLAEEDEFREKEAALAAQLATAQESLAALSASSAAELDTLRAQLASDTSAADVLRARVASLEESVARLQAEVSELQRERDELRAELERARARCEEVEAAKEVDVAALEDKLVAAEAAREAASTALEASTAAAREAQDTLRARDTRVAELEGEQAALERRLAAQDAASGTKDEAVASLERQVASTQAELASVLAARDAALLAADERATALESERDLALASISAAEQRVRDVGELAALHRSEHVAAQAQTARERDAAERALAAELERVRGDLAAQQDKVAQLERRLEHYKRLEDQRATYERHRYAGTDALKTRLAELQARTSTPVQLPPAAAPAQRSVSGASRTSSSGGMETNVELQVRNDELAARMGELERLAEERQSAREADAEAARQEAGELRGAVDLQKRQLDETAARAEDWRQKYLAVQRLLDQLTAAPPTASTPPASDTENRRPSSLFLPSTSASTTVSRASSTSRRAPLGASQSPSAGGPPSSPGPGPGPGATWLSSRPPPLPYSPHQRDAEAAALRKKRRETIAKDLARLREGKVVGEKREGWDSPGASPSPTKSEFALGARR
ncbi:kinesin motor domain-containing protein [Rhodotorula diobovata]|uniref:Kinesin motor domain-containing protein n=1 Tax=Rhodotorula diobovata TaxID=5288 RepID=A0A5C5FN16_9BASI|nr:kinesin motor domain-containing protein [Rhodotorula diobovata]